MNKNIISIILKSLIILLILTAGIRAQNNKSHGELLKKLSGSYQFPKLPMVSGKMSPGPYNVIQVNFKITLRDGVKLDCSKFYPDTNNIYLPNGFPGVIMCHGYGDRKETLAAIAHDQASYGYSVYTYSMRGQGSLPANQKGLSNLISTTEALDLMQFVDSVKHDRTSRLDSSNILITGGSQGGMIPYMAACMGMKVKCIISSVASPEFASNWIENGSIKMTFLWTITYTPDSAVYTPQVKAMESWVYSTAKDKWDSLAYWLPKDRDFKLLVSQNTVPIMLENSWQDYFFSAYGNISTTQLLTSPKYYYFGAVQGHGGDVSPIENTWHESFYNDWFNYWLFGDTYGLLTRKTYEYASTTFPVSSGMWSFVHDNSDVWPPSGLINQKLYFNPNKQLKTNPNTKNNTVILKNTVTAGFTLEDAVGEDFTGTLFNNNFKKDSLVFTSPVLANKTRMTGTPAIKLDYSSNMNRAQFNFQVYEVQGTTQKLVSRINYTDRNNYTHNVRKTVTVNGNSHSHIFLKGNKIRVVIKNLDTTPFDVPFLATNPFVLPVMDNGKSKMYLSSNSYISLPLQVTTMMGPVANIFVDENPELSADENSNLPVTFNLKQNFPNPFNPVTSIEYSVPQNSYVTLKVYDISGKEIASLVNSQTSAGNYSVNFNADVYHLSSGIYFYKLTAGNEVAVKKLMLIK